MNLHPGRLYVDADPPPRLLFRFSESKSRDFPSIMKAAHAGELTEEQAEYKGKHTTIFQVAFHLRTLENTQAATKLAGWLYDKRLVEVYGIGLRLTITNAFHALCCYERSWGAPTPESYCWKARPATSIEGVYEQVRSPITQHVAVDPFTRTAESYRTPLELPLPVWFAPCRFLATYELSVRHPDSIRQQVEGQLTHQGCRWCPRLDSLSSWEERQWGIEKESTSLAN